MSIYDTSHQKLLGTHNHPLYCQSLHPIQYMQQWGIVSAEGTEYTMHLCVLKMEANFLYEGLIILLMTQNIIRYVIKKFFNW